MRSLLLRYAIIFFTLLHSIGSSIAQNDSGNYTLGVKGYFGFLAAHRQVMSHLQTGHSPGFEISFGKQTTGNLFWEQIYNYPAIGISYLLINSGNPEQVGNIHALFPYINFPVKRGDHGLLSFRLGFGAGFAEKIFDRVENYKNVAIGSHLNVAGNFQLEYSYNLTSKLAIETGIGLTHFSNGTYASPNRGLNFTLVNSGVKYHFSGSSANMRKDTVPGFEQEIMISLIVGGSLKEIVPIDNKKYSAFTISANVAKPVGHKSRVGAGLDIFHDSSLKRKLEYAQISPNEFDSYRPGVNLFYELVLSRLTVDFHFGAYPYSKYKGDGYLYHRLGLRYLLGKHLLINYSLKSHFARADFMEIGAGYQF